MTRWGCLAALAVVCLVTTLRADEAQLAALQKAADDAKAAQTAGEPAVKAARENAKKLADAVTSLKIDFSKAEATHPDLVKKATEARDAFAKADDERKAALDAFIAARKAALDAQGKDNAAATQDAYLKAAEALAAKVTAAKTAFDAVGPAVEAAIAPQQVLAGHPAKIIAAEKAVAEFQPQLQQAEAAYAALAKTALDHQIALEAALVEAGKLVSFAKSVAPIFAQRCVACHNARTAKGRLNMETYANLMKGGESGEVVLAHKPGDSNLQIQIEAGEMPKDADPLTPEQIAVVKKWIETGARLDAGVSPTAALITIMPKPIQPPPPETYRVPVPVMAVAFSPDGNLVATSGYREVILWNAADGQLVRRISNLAERPHDIEFTPNGEQLAVAAGTPGQLGEVKLFTVADGSLAADLFTTDDEVFSVAISPDGGRIAATCADRSVRVYDLATKQRLTFIEDHADWVMDVAWSPDGTKLATASRDKTAKVFDAKTGDALATFNGHGQPVFGVGFLPDGSQVVSGGRDNKLRVWNVSDAKQAREIGGFGGEVFRLVVTPDGHSLATSADKQIRLHKLADGSQVRAFAGHNEWVYAVAPHLASKRLVTGSHDGEVRVWNYEDGKTTLNFIAAPGYKPQVAAAQ
uniref:Cytochrome c domain-containing protein n=1 Tax=Schlesneria paludicola TaxID=360056 RepID=A0A7C2K2E7_9PLAN